MARVIQSTRTVFKMYLPCLSYDAFDRTGQYPVWTATQLIEVVVQEAFHKSNFSNIDILKKRFIYAAVAANYNVSKEWYKKTRNTNVNVELILAMYLVHIGRSSVYLFHTIQDAQTSEQYISVLLKMAFIERKTQKSMALPNMDLDISENLKQLSSYQSPLLGCLQDISMITNIHDEPQNGYAFHYQVRIEPSFIDQHNHTNNSHYLRFCLDCATMAVKSGHLKEFSGDIAQYNVHKGKTLYQRMTFLGDKLDVLTWPSKDAELELCFLIKRGEHVVYSCTLCFYPLEPDVPRAKY